MNCKLLIVIGCVALASQSALAAPAAVVPETGLVAELQPLRVHRDALPPQLLALAKRADKKRYGDVCAAIGKLRVDLLHKAAPLFYQPDRRRGGDVEGVSHFLKTHVEGPKPMLQIVQELFVPSAGMRALAVDACIRAGTPKDAEPFVADLAILSHDPQSRLTLALLRALQKGDWRAGTSLLDQTVTGPRAGLVRALAGEPPGAASWVSEAWRHAASPEEVRLVQDVAARLHVAVPTTPAGSAMQPTTGGTP